MNKERFNKVYDLLVSIGGAYESERDSFIHHHTKVHGACVEWRFGGKLLFGGKYRSATNTVDCYLEDEDKEALEIIRKLNNALKIYNM